MRTMAVAGLAFASGLGIAACLGLSIAAAGTAAAAAKTEEPRHLIYLHGRIVQEQQNARPVHKEYGPYELETILAALRERGFVVSGEIRPKESSLSESADRVVAQVRGLLESGVPADRITVVGASMGASIALLASVRLGNPDLRFALLGACLSANIASLREEEGKPPSGRLLFVREKSDDLSDPCPPLKKGAEPPSPYIAREVVIATGLKHGFLYRPLAEWMDPVVAWAQDSITGPTTAPSK